jgi:hypothetical protein
MSSYFGKYRGTVENNVDPQQMGRVQVSVPAILGEGRLSWAMPCSPYAGPSVGFFAVPPNGAQVWVEFEGGDPDYPIYSGGFWNLGEAPAQPAVPFVKIFKTDCISLKLDDTPGAGGFTLEIKPPASATALKISGTAAGIEISNGSAKIVLSPVSVSINDGALEVI